jgi:hypothetical protein
MDRTRGYLARSLTACATAIALSGAVATGSAQARAEALETRFNVYAAAFSHSGYVDPGVGFRIDQGLHRLVVLEGDLMYVSARDSPVCIGMSFTCPEHVPYRVLFGSLGLQLRAPLRPAEPYGGLASGSLRSRWGTREEWDSRPTTAVFAGVRLPGERFGAFGEARVRGEHHRTAVGPYRHWNREIAVGGSVRVR